MSLIPKKPDSRGWVNAIAAGWVEIVLPLLSQEDEEAVVAARDQEDDIPRSAHSMALVPPQEIPQLSLVLRALPAWFVSAATKLIVTLQFPGPKEPHIPTGPRALQPSTNRHHFVLGNSTHTIPSEHSYQRHPNFRAALCVAHDINRFASLQKLDVVLGTPSNMRTPMTIPQLNCLLPFYDLEYAAWNAAWRAPFMVKSEVLVSWPLSYIDRQRGRLLVERKKIIKEMEREAEDGLGGSP